MRKILAFIMTCILTCSLAACSSTPPADPAAETNTEATADAAGETENYKIGFALQTLDVAVWERMVEGMQSKADELGNVDFTCLVADSNVATQISNIENMIAQGFDAIIVHVFDKENRLFYDLERIWKDGKITDIADL